MVLSSHFICGCCCSELIPSKSPSKSPSRCLVMLMTGLATGHNQRIPTWHLFLRLVLSKLPEMTFALQSWGRKEREKKTKTNPTKDVDTADTAGVNPMPSGYLANGSHLCHTRIYKAIFSMKALQPSLPAIWHFTGSFEQPKGHVVVSGWQCPGLSCQEEDTHSTDRKLDRRPNMARAYRLFLTRN